MCVARTVVLVEGRSDAVAVSTLARRCGRDFPTEGVSVVDMGGATNVGHCVSRYGPSGEGCRILGLCDVGESRFFMRAFHRAGLAAGLGAEPSSYGVFVCVEDLEDELIRALGVPAVEAVIEAAGELGALRTLQRQPAQRDRPVTAQLRRFFGTHSGRKERYAALLVDALDSGTVPEPLERLVLTA